MKQIVPALALFIFSFHFSFAQKQAYVWYFGDFAGLDFNSGSPVPLSNSQMNTLEGCASIADKSSGQLLFYTDGTSVWDRTQAVMPNGTSLLGNYSSTQSAVIIPMPGSATQFYIFTVDAQAGYFLASNTGYGGVAYSIVDMTKNGGNGDIITASKNTHLLTPTCEKLTAVRNCNGKDIWVIVHQWNSSSFYAYLVTSAGVQAPVISTVGGQQYDAGSGQNAEAIGYLKCSPNGEKLAMASDFYLNEVQIFDFNNSTGVISNPIIDTNFPITYDDLTGDPLNNPYGVTFSPDNSRLYVSESGFPSLDGLVVANSNIYQYDMTAGSNAAILNSRKVVYTTDLDAIGGLQIGPDDKIYVAKEDDDFGPWSYLDVINNPNALGSACNYVSDGLYLGSVGLTCYGLPDMVESFTAVPYSASLNYTTCSGNNTLTFNDTILNGTINVLWNFGDTASGTNDTSSQKNPVHTFSSSGSYKVSLFVENACTTDSFAQTIFTGGSISVTALPDTTVCSGSPVPLRSTGGIIDAWSPAADLNDSTLGNPTAYPTTTTTYTVIASSGGCSSTATVTVTVEASPPTPSIMQSQDTLYCSFDPSYTSYQWYDSSAIINGATKAFLVVSKSGNYNVSVTNENGCGIAVGITVVITGINSYLFENSISLSPNPAKDQLIITGKLTGDRVNLLIYDLLGRIVYSSEEHASGAFSKQIDLTGFSKGIYMVKIDQAERNWVGRFIKE